MTFLKKAKKDDMLFFIIAGMGIKILQERYVLLIIKGQIGQRRKLLRP